MRKDDGHTDGEPVQKGTDPGRWRRRLTYVAIGFAVGLATATLVGCCCTRPMSRSAGAYVAPFDTTHTIPSSAVVDSTTLIEMHNVHFRIDADLALEVHHLSGEMIPQGRTYVFFDDPAGYVIRIRSAEVGMQPGSLLALLQDYVFDYDGAPLTITRMAIDDTLLVQEGIMHKVVDIPFTLKASVSVTPEGLIRLHPESMKICTIPGKGLMKALGIQLDELLDLRGAKGVTAEKNDLLLDPEVILPPPAIRGRLVSIRVAPDQLVQTFVQEPGTPPIAEAPPPPADDPNYMFFHGGTLRFGDLALLGSELQIVDADPSDPFDFFQDDYQPQLKAGYSRATETLGQVTYMPDYADVGHEVEPGEKLPVSSR